MAFGHSSGKVADGSLEGTVLGDTKSQIICLHPHQVSGVLRSMEARQGRLPGAGERRRRRSRKGGKRRETGRSREGEEGTSVRSWGPSRMGERWTVPRVTQ